MVNKRLTKRPFPTALPRAVIDPAVRGALAVEQVDHLVFRHPGAVDQAAVAADRGAVGAPLDDADEELVAFLAEKPLVAGPAELGAEPPVLRQRRGCRAAPQFGRGAGRGKVG